MINQTSLNQLIRDAIEQALGEVPANAETLYKLGTSLYHMNQLQEALTCLLRYIGLQPGNCEAYNLIGNIYAKVNQLDKACSYLKQAIQINPAYAEAYNNLGGVYYQANQLEMAEQILPEAICLRPNFYEAYKNLGTVYSKMNRLKEAEQVLLQAIELKPDYADAIFTLSLVELLTEKFTQGWKNYEYRPSLINRKQPDIPRWQGEDLSGRSILLYHEQGLGDTLQFIRYAWQVAALGAKTTVWIQTPLAQLEFQGSPAFSLYEGTDSPPEIFDFACPLLSLPLIFSTDAATIPQYSSYIRADANLVQKWREHLKGIHDTGLLKVGVAWAGNHTHTDDHNRSIAFDTFQLLFLLTGLEWISLQVGPKAEEVNCCPSQIRDVSVLLTNFAETAAVIDNLDLVITVDTSVAHLAGAMGKEVWALLSSMPDWRWMLEREDTPWYPSMRLFRQRERGNWVEVLARVKAALQQKMAKHNFSRHY
ncbi:hypothetical protein SPSIL_013410 [Sporomusa silvacetica DSM 10669]|uniref:TPR repeat-containing protein YrrB n=1 Tax=Sporomusa silvacetica DSM 10669 TaxID=1123289 RepID=A0ABZ3IIA5_9FIRM|nr:tetratricopeptide repeat protein [Sporomusa silvacetica]OZC16785.1 TPR repeat-containing protein YrrB [Sporomusa silvacetica DSM 10669]